MAESDLTAAIEAAARAVAVESIDVDRDDCRLIIEAAVRAAAPLIEQAALAAAAHEIDHTTSIPIAEDPRDEFGAFARWLRVRAGLESYPPPIAPYVTPEANGGS